jgi:HSP20 family protein
MIFRSPFGTVGFGGSMFSTGGGPIEDVIKDIFSDLGMPEDASGVRKGRKGDNIVVTVDMPGVEKKDIKVKYEEKMLRMSAENKNTGRKYHKHVFIREEVDVEGIKASYKDGVLRIELPMLKKGRDIKVE